ncbi:hypothetical protein Adt_15585 [Abeliophyllum distichum]|uniref:Uncharacterized protein n=1 Tax=Abeliophyllum distichum TaxID=126358 RepID=A0ABD1U3I5_9LAMI
MQDTLIEVQHTQHNMQHELQQVSIQVCRLQHEDVSIRSDQHTITYAYDEVNRWMLYFGNRLKMFNGTFSQISQAINSLRTSTSVAPSTQLRPSSPHLPSGST